MTDRLRNAVRIGGLCLVLSAVVAGVHAGPQDLPPADALVARHVEAIGGADAYRAVQSVHARGRLEVAAQRIVAAFELFMARPARTLYRVNVPGIGVIENGYDGSVGWSVNPVVGPEVMSGRQLTEAAEDAWFDGPLHEPARVREMTTIEATTFDGRPAYKVRVLFRAGHQLFEFFDVESGLLLGSEALRATPQGEVPTVSILRDYRQFGTLMQPTTFVQRALGIEQVLTISSYEYDRVDPATFALPPSVAGLLPGPR
jgi:hypothetical protein